MFLVAATIAVIINSLIATIFLRLGKYAKSHTAIDEQYYSFKYIFLMETFNMGIIQLVISLVYFSSVTKPLLAFTGMKRQFYEDFTPYWYMDTGRKICVFIFLSAFISAISDLRTYLTVLIRRFYDRKFRSTVKTELDDEDDDKVNTRMKTMQ